MKTAMTTQSQQINFLERGKSLPIDVVSADSEFNTRKKIQGIEELSESINTLGQTMPVGVVQNGDAYDLVFGFRRYNAIKALNEAGHETQILCDVVDGEDKNKLILLNVQENVSREQLSHSEEYEAITRLSSFMTRNEIMETLGVTKTWITQRLKLGEISPVLRDAVDEGLSVRSAQAINILPAELHEEFAARSAGQSVSNVTDSVQARLDELSGIDPEPVDGDDDIELLSDDDLEPLDESEDEEPVPDEESGNELQEYLSNYLTQVDDPSEERKEEKRILLASIRWNKVTDADKILEILQYCLEDEDESDVDEDDESDD